MKKIIVLFALFLGLSVSAQDEFPIKNPELIRGKSVEIVEHGMFFRDSQLENFYYDAKVDLTGHRAKVVNVITNRLARKDYNGDPETEYILELDTDLGFKLYYEFMSSSSPIILKIKPSDADFKLPADYYGAYVTVEAGKAPGEKKYWFTRKNLNYKITKYKTGTKSRYNFEYWMFAGRPPGQPTNGMTILFTDGTKLDIPDAKVTMETKDVIDEYFYTSIDLKDKEIAQLKGKTISHVILSAKKEEFVQYDNFKGIFTYLTTK